MKQQPFYQCEHCIYFIQHYNISDDRIYKVGCGHCISKDKDLKPSLRDCKFFTQRIEEKENIQNQENLLKILKQIEKSLKYFKLYLTKNEEGQMIDDCLKEIIK